jgi:malonyl-CoA/methylmalonyl-CoA synthetase
MARATAWPGRTAVVSRGESHTYGDLLSASARVAAALLRGRPDLDEARVAFLVPPGFEHVAVQWGIWRAGGIAVPLAASHPPPELEYVVADADADTVVCDPGSEARLAAITAALRCRLERSDHALAADTTPLPTVATSRRAMMLYTSGTTGRPKGVVTTHDTLAAQIETLFLAWEWSAADRILGVLPLHHVHGIVNVLCCALWSGAVCELPARLDVEEVWRRLTAGGVTLFMGVPTIYGRLIAAWESAPPAQRRTLSERARALRLMVSGSAALPVSTLERWREITGHTLLERYGMTEIGMALSNPLHGERVAGSVGAPLPGVTVRLVDETGAAMPPGTPGEIEVRGPGVFKEYWRQAEATAAAFHDGWFRTGDIAVVEDGRYRLLGRASVDIIKSGGYKLSALEIEECLRRHPAVADCAVVGVPDTEWGEAVAAAVVPVAGRRPSAAELRAWVRARLAPYKVPKRIGIVAELERNAMGKVLKAAVRRLFDDPAAPAN